MPGVMLLGSCYVVYVYSLCILIYACFFYIKIYIYNIYNNVRCFEVVYVSVVVFGWCLLDPRLMYVFVFLSSGRVPPLRDPMT